MGKLPGLDNMRKERIDLLQEESVNKVENKTQQDSSIAVQQDNNIAVYKDSSKKMQPKTSKTKKKEKVCTVDCYKIIGSRVSTAFKKIVGLYCIDNDIKEVDLIKSVVEGILSNVECLGDTINSYDTNDNGKDYGKTIYAKCSTELKKNFSLFCKNNDITENFALAQGVAKRIGFKKN